MGLGPLVRLTVEGMRTEIIQHLNTMFDTQKADVATAVNEAVKTFDWQKEISIIVRQELEKKLKEMVERAVREAVSESGSRLMMYVKAAVDSAIDGDVERALGNEPERPRRTR